MSTKSFSLLRRQSGTIPRVYSRATAFALAILTACICSLTGSRAMAWGMLPHLNKLKRSYLFYPVLRHHRINYCISMWGPNPGHFNAKSIAEQTEMALRLWLHAVRKVTGPVTIRQVPCGDYYLNLKISVEPSSRHWAMSEADNNGYGTYFYHVFFNTNSTYLMFWHSKLTREPVYDFQYLIKKYIPGMSLENVMAYTNTEKMDGKAFSNWSKSPPPEAEFSSYVPLIHEIGHGFGLCDTSNNRLYYDCDPSYVSAVNPQDQPSSIMRSAVYLYLTSDDKAGIRAVFKRFLWLKRTK